MSSQPLQIALMQAIARGASQGELLAIANKMCGCAQADQQGSQGSIIFKANNNLSLAPTGAMPLGQFDGLFILPEQTRLVSWSITQKGQSAGTLTVVELGVLDVSGPTYTTLSQLSIAQPQAQPNTIATALLGVTLPAGRAILANFPAASLPGAPVNPAFASDLTVQIVVRKA